MDRYELIDKFRAAAADRASAQDQLALPHWSLDHWQQFAAICEPVEIDAGEALITSGRSERTLYLVVDGSVEVAYIVRPSLTVSIMSHVGPGSVVGEQAFFDSAPRSANVWAVEHSVVLKVELNAFTRFADSNPRLGYDMVFALARVLAQRLRTTTVKAAG